MRTLLLHLALPLVLLSSCGSDNSPADSPAAAAPAAGAPAPASAEVSAAQALADSLVALPAAEPADKAAARHYAQFVADWQGSDLDASVKEHPVVRSGWARYRYVLRTVARSRGLPRVQPEDVATWNGLAGRCETVATMLLALTKEPNVTVTQALPTLLGFEGGTGQARFAAERHLKYLLHPQTRKQ